MTRAYGYLRVSTPGQIDGDGYDRQRAAIEAYAAANEIKIVRFFEERGVTGAAEWSDRPAWVEMVAELGTIRTIVIERLDRLARDLGVQEWIVRTLAGRKIEIISTSEPDLCSSDPTRVLFRQIMGAISQFDKAMITAKLRSARERMRKRGEKCDGRWPYGYDPKFPQEEEVLRLILQWHGEGYSFNEISIKLNEAHVSTRDSGTWFGATVSRIVKREEKKNA
jgi:DNA invertase Pin-like site-specific DNA recombinase